MFPPMVEVRFSLRTVRSRFCRGRLFLRGSAKRNFFAKGLDFCGRVWYNRCVILAHALHGRNPEGGVLSMAKKQESYELMTVFSLKNGEEAAKELVEKFREKIASAATLDEVNEWGKRKLAYPINDEPDGYYTLYTFTSTPDVPAEVERVLNITDGVLRSLVTVK